MRESRPTLLDDAEQMIHELFIGREIRPVTLETNSTERVKVKCWLGRIWVPYHAWVRRALSEPI